MRLDLFVKLKYESNTTILFVGIEHSIRDLLSDFLTRKLAICVRYGKWYQRFLWDQFALASWEFYV